METLIDILRATAWPAALVLSVWIATRTWSKARTYPNYIRKG